MSRFSKYIPVPSWQVAATLAGVAATALILFLLNFVLIDSRPYPSTDGHQNRAIAMAYNWVKCGEYSSLAPDQGVKFAYGGYLENLTAQESLHRPIGELAAMQAGSEDAYCGVLFAQETNEDSSLFYTFSFLLRIMPGASAAQLYTLATAILSVGFALVGYAIWKWTRSVVLSAGILFVAVLWHVQLTLFLFTSNHMFGWIFLLYSAFLMAWVVSEVSAGRIKRAVFAAFAAGLMTVFAANMRSTVQVEIPFLVIVMALGVMAATPADNGVWWRSRKIKHVGAILAVFAIAWFGYGRIAISPYEAIAEGGLTAHPIAHVLVIGLAVPPNDLARDMGIVWFDGRGFEIAEEYRPGSMATWSQYEDAMTDYYIDLWQERPGDMVQTYITKANVTGTSLKPILENIGIGNISPLKLVPNGLILGLILTLLMWASFFYPARTPIATFLIRALLIFLLGGYFVSMVIFPIASFYVPELGFAFLVMTVMFWWGIGHFVFKLIDRYRVANVGLIGGGVRLARRWW